MSKNNNISKLDWIIPLIPLLVIGVLYFSNVFRIPELKSIDLRYKIRGEEDISHSDVIIIAIDEPTFQGCVEDYPYPRSYYAELVENLNEAGVSRIVFDIEFTQHSKTAPHNDTLLAQKIGANNNVVLSGTLVKDMARNYTYPLKPMELIRKETQAWGIVNDVQDIDGFVRRYNIFYPSQKKNYFTIGTVAFALEGGLEPGFTWEREGKYCLIQDSVHQKSLPIRTYRTGLWQEQTFYINYYGPARTFPYFSMSQVLDDSEFDLRQKSDTDYMEIWEANSSLPLFLRINFLSKQRQAEAQKALEKGQREKVRQIIQQENPFRDKIAMVGVTLPELHDNRYTPFYSYQGKHRLMPGVETHAHALQTMLDQNYLKKTPFWVNGLMILLFSYLIAFGVKIIRPLLAGIASFVIIILIFFASVILFNNFNLLLPIMPGFAIVIVSYFGSIAYQYFTEEKEKRKIRNMFKTYTSPKVLKYLEANPETFSLKGEKRKATVYFSDIANFTSVSEQLSAEQLTTLLNDYLSPMTDILMRYGGYVDKYEGDAIMCDFNVPFFDPDHTWKACYAALDQQEFLQKRNAHYEAQYSAHIKVRYGINTGTVSAGNMGSKHRFQYTVMGDTVNQASRFEGANKFYKTSIMIGEETYQNSKDKIEARLLDKIVVVGKSKPVLAYELLAKKGELSSDKQLLVEEYNQGLQAYFQREWDTAVQHFQKALEIMDDPPSRILLERCQEYAQQPPEKDWNGEFNLSIK